MTESETSWNEEEILKLVETQQDELERLQIEKEKWQSIAEQERKEKELLSSEKSEMQLAIQMLKKKMQEQSEKIERLNGSDKILKDNERIMSLNARLQNDKIKAEDEARKSIEDANSLMEQAEREIKNAKQQQENVNNRILSAIREHDIEYEKRYNKEMQIEIDDMKNKVESRYFNTVTLMFPLAILGAFLGIMETKSEIIIIPHLLLEAGKAVIMPFVDVTGLLFSFDTAFLGLISLLVVGGGYFVVGIVAVTAITAYLDKVRSFNDFSLALAFSVELAFIAAMAGWKYSPAIGLSFFTWWVLVSIVLMMFLYHQGTIAAIKAVLSLFGRFLEEAIDRIRY